MYSGVEKACIGNKWVNTIKTIFFLRLGKGQGRPLMQAGIYFKVLYKGKVSDNLHDIWYLKYERVVWISAKNKPKKLVLVEK